MNILLIHPYLIEERIHEEDISVPPIGLYQVAAVLKENAYDVALLNWYDIQKNPQRIQEVLEEKQPDVIGFSILHANRWGGIEIARTAKRMFPNTKIVFGGIGATFLWEHLLTHFPEIDYIVIGEGEQSFLDLIRWVENEDATDPKGIKGIAYRGKKQPIRTEPADPLTDLDSLPIPARYFEYSHLASSRGCAWQCAFCGSPRFWGRKIRFRSPEHFVQELEILYQKGLRFFFISDDTFTIQKTRLIAICQGIIEKRLKISWNAISRVDHIDDDILYWMRKAGCIQISYGIESGSEKIRKRLNKNIDTKEIKRAFQLTTRYGILARAYFIYGCPGETDETIEETIRLIHAIKPMSAIFYILDLFPGTELYETLKKKQGFSDDVWLNRIEGIMYFETDPNLSDDIILEYGQRLRRGYYENLHSFVDAIELIDREDLYELHADFCSRLGMTFSHGDYAKNEFVQEKVETAEKFYRKALSYYPDHRAYLGLAILKQRTGEFKASIRYCREGIKHFPESLELGLCLGLSYMNLRDYQRALQIFQRFPDSKEARDYMAICYKEAAGR